MSTETNNNVWGINTNTDQLKEQLISLNKSLDELQKRQKDLVNAGEKTGKAYQDITAQIRIAKDAIKNTTEHIDDNIRALNSAKNSLEQNRGFLQALKTQYDELTKSQDVNSKEAKALNVQIGTLTNTIARQEEKLEKSRTVFDLHSETNKSFTSSFAKLKTVTGEFGPSLESAAEGFNAMKSGLSAVKTGFQSVGGAIKTTGFGLLVLVLQSVVEYFTHTTDGAKKLKAIISAVGAVVQVFKDGLASVGRLLINTFTNPVKSIKELGALLYENIINRFKAVLVIWEGVKNFDLKKVSNGVLQAATGVTNLTDKVSGAYNKVMNASVKVENTSANNHKNEKKRHAERQQMHKDEDNMRLKSLARSQPKPPKPDTVRLPELLPAKFNTFADQLAQDKKQYDEELTLLKDQLDKKLITQQEFELQNQQLQEKYHQSIGLKVKEFHHNELDNAVKNLQSIIDLHRAGDRINADDKNLKKAFLPGQKFNAEKKLIDDKYAYELIKAQQAGQDTAAITEKYEQDKTALTKQYEQQRRDFALNTAQQVSDKAFAIIGANIKSSSDAKIRGLEKDKAAELGNKNLTATQRKAIEDKYKKKEAEEKIKAFKAEQRASVVQAVVNGALAITKATAQTGVLSSFVIPGIIASTALQVATIIAQKPPAFAKGGHFVSDGRGALLPGYSRTDNTNAYLRSGEAVVVSEAMRNPWARNLVSAINVAHGGRDFSVPNLGKGYAVGGIFTDGGNANRYYNQPMNDIKDMANTLAYQMINNFPPIYVDVKDVNNQQNILAQTVNRVNL